MEYTPWAQFVRDFRWNQGEHVAIVAPTGAGKTTLERELLRYRACSIFFATKLDDDLYKEILKKHGFRRVESFEDIKPWDKKIMLWPSHRDTIEATKAHQTYVFKRAMDKIVKQRAWTVWFDECKYMCEFLGMRTQVTFCLEQLRSIKATTISGSQRPAFLSRSVLSNCTHVFLWKTTDADDLKRLSDIGGIDKRAVAAQLAELGEHEFLYIHTRGTTTRMAKSQVGR